MAVLPNIAYSETSNTLQLKRHKQRIKPCSFALYKQWYKTDKASEHSNSVQWTYCIDFEVNYLENQRIIVSPSLTNMNSNKVKQRLK